MQKMTSGWLVLLILWLTPAPTVGCNISVVAEQIANQETRYFQSQFSTRVNEWVGDRTPEELARQSKIAAGTFKVWQSRRPSLVTLTLFRHADSAAELFGITRAEFLEAAGVSAQGFDADWFVRFIMQDDQGKHLPLERVLTQLEMNRTALQDWRAGRSYPKRWQVRALAMWKAKAKNLSEGDTQLFIAECYAHLGYLLPPEPTTPPVSAVVASTEKPLSKGPSPARPKVRAPEASEPGYGIAGFRFRFVAPADYFSTTALAAWRGTLHTGVFYPENLQRFLKGRNLNRLLRHSFNRLEARELLKADWARFAGTFGMTFEDVDFGAWISIALQGKDLQLLAAETNLDEKRLRDETLGDVRGQFNRQEVVRIARALGARDEEGLIAAGFFPTHEEFFASGELRDR